MKYHSRRFKNLTLALKELEPLIRNGEHLQTGKPFKKFGDMRSRELLANWLLCAAFNFDCGSPERLTPITINDPLGGDGILYDTISEAPFTTEHVLVPAAQSGATVDIEALILKAINGKRAKGAAAYASGKTLVVFLNAGGGGAWFPTRVTRQLPDPLYFEVVWVVALHHVEDGEYTYSVAQLELREGHAPTWLVRIAKDFNTWEVKRTQ